MTDIDESVHTGRPTSAGFPFPPAKPRRRPRLHHSNFHTTWRSETALLNSTVKRLAAAVGILIAVLAPFTVGADIVRIFVLAVIASIAAIGLNIVSGVAGQLSLGHAGFLGIGAFSAAWVTTNQGWSFWWSLPIAAVLAGLFGLVLAPVSLRLRGLYLSVVTIGFVSVMQHVFRAASGITGGVDGNRVVLPEVAGVDLLRGGKFGPLELGAYVPYYFVVLGLALITIVLTRNLLRSRTGRNFAAIRDQDIAAGVVGVSVFGTKTQAFVISSAITGVAGALMGGLLRVVTFEQWDLMLSVEYLAMIVLGGLGTITGSILGAVFVIALPEVVDRATGILPFVSDEGGFGLTPERVSVILYGISIAVVMVVEPLGLYGLWLRIRHYFSAWPFRK